MRKEVEISSSFPELLVLPGPSKRTKLSTFPNLEVRLNFEISVAFPFLLVSNPLNAQQNCAPRVRIRFIEHLPRCKDLENESHEARRGQFLVWFVANTKVLANLLENLRIHSVNASPNPLEQGLVGFT